MSGSEPLAEIIRELDRVEIPHMLAGSFASAFHGEPRTTYDIDLVIDPSHESLGRLVDSLSPEQFYVSSEAAEEAWRGRGQFNAIHLASGWKVDLILRKDRAFSREEFCRRQKSLVQGTTVFVATAEDTILAKLEWAKAGDSERQLRDVVSIIDIRGPELDRSYIERWVGELGIGELWARAEREASSEET